MTKTEATEANIPIVIVLKVSEQFLRDILVTACEGGSNYWLMCERTERDADLNYLRLVKPMGNGDFNFKEPFDAELFKDGFDPKADITPTTIQRGIARLYEPGILPKRDDLRAKMSGTDPDYDADDADVLLQLGFFGELVFG